MEVKLIPDKLAKRQREIEPYQFRERMEVDNWRAMDGRLTREAARPGLDESAWRRFGVGDTWGGRDATLWLRTRVVIPREWAGQKVVLRLRLGGEALVYLNGRALQGIDDHHSEVELSSVLSPGEEACLAVEAWSGMGNETHTFKESQLVVIDPLVRRFLFDLQMARELADAVSAEPQLREAILRAADRAVDRIDYLRKGSESFRESIEEASKLLREELARLTAEYGPRGRLHLIGHAHIDLAWLWPVRETRRKAASTFATALQLMRAYPAFYFGQSQPQLYEWLKEDYPEIFEGIRRRVAEGRWEPLGALWVESDCNLSGGEALVRQVVYGKRFFRKEFGYDSRVAWLPDAFGFTWSLPQILRKAGIEYFVTTKISWNQFNRFPYDLFWWEGADGSRVLAHFYFNPGGGYNGNIRPAQLRQTWDNFQQKELADTSLFSYGYGDGGGGPTWEMLEMYQRLQTAPGLPRLSTGPVQSFLDHLPREGLPVWNDELYLELHRGTFTTQSAVKKANRRAEFALRRAEIFSSWASLRAGAPYPAAELERAWKMLLRNQFHDILPGSGIHEIYEDALRELEEVLRVATCLSSKAVGVLLSGPEPAGKAGRSEQTVAEDETDQIIVFNDLSWERADLVQVVVPRELIERRQAGGHCLAVQTPGGVSLPCQVVDLPDTDDNVGLLFEPRELPPLGWAVYRLQVLGATSAEGAAGETAGDTTGERVEELPSVNGSAFRTVMRGGSWEITTPFYEISLARDGSITRLWDRRVKRDVLLPGERGNVIWAFEDKPNHWDAWDIDLFYEKKGWEVQENARVELVESGPLRLCFRIYRDFHNSHIVQEMRLYRHLPRIDFDTEIDWHERDILLKVAFPVAVRNRQATYEIAYGHIERPTHTNTTWDRARFEVAGHKWVDLSEDGYGVSLLNDGKYGHDVHGSTIRLTLLKSPVWPDPRADEGRQRFTYSLLPHPGGWRSAGTVARAYELNSPAWTRFVPAGSGDTVPAEKWRYQFLQIGQENAILEVWKAPDLPGGDGRTSTGQQAGNEWILRLYEAFGRRGPVTLTFGRPVRSAERVNLLEEPECCEPGAAPVVEGERITINLRPLEICTLRVCLS
ncbi:MAG: alpha-mannosidase [Limnochordales bacterium]|nr:alpha-mannosidase [Limnochordales bacterium]